MIFKTVLKEAFDVIILIPSLREEHVMKKEGNYFSIRVSVNLVGHLCYELVMIEPQFTEHLISKGPVDALILLCCHS